MGQVQEDVTSIPAHALQQRMPCHVHWRHSAPNHWILLFRNPHTVQLNLLSIMHDCLFYQLYVKLGCFYRKVPKPAFMVQGPGSSVSNESDSKRARSSTLY